MKTKKQLNEELKQSHLITDINPYSTWVCIEGYASVEDLRYIADRLEALIELEKIDKTPEKELEL